MQQALNEGYLYTIGTFLAFSMRNSSKQKLIKFVWYKGMYIALNTGNKKKYINGIVQQLA